MALLAPELTFAFEIAVEVAPAERIGHTGGEELWLVPITGGTVTGPRLTGTVEPGGADRFVDRGAFTQLDAAYCLRASDGALIDVANRGVWRPDPAVQEQADRGEDVDETRLYYRTQPVFRTDAPAYRWLAETVFVGMARNEAGRICIRCFALG